MIVREAGGDVEIVERGEIDAIPFEAFGFVHGADDDFAFVFFGIKAETVFTEGHEAEPFVDDLGEESGGVEGGLGLVDGIVLTKTAGELVDDGEVDVVLIEGLADGDEELVYGEDGGVEPETDLIFEGVEELENWFG